MISMRYWLPANSVMIALSYLLVGRLVLNIRSMRSVMKNPPTTLLVAATMAMTPSTVANVLFFSPTRTIAPTTAIASSALVKRHERRVQQRRNVADDFESDEGRQHEDEKRVDQVGTHELPQGLKPRISCVAGPTRPLASAPAS